MLSQPLIKISPFLVLLLFGSSCASRGEPLSLDEQEPYHSSADWSYAKNVLVAAGFNGLHIFDTELTKEEIASISAQQGDINDGKPSDTYIVAGAAVTALSPPLSLSAGPAVVLDVLFNLTKNESNASRSWIFGWSQDTSQGNRFLITSITDTFLESVHAYFENDSSFINIVEPFNSFDEVKAVRYVNNSSCAPDIKELYICMVGLIKPSKTNVWDARYSSYKGSMLSYAPDFVSDGEALFYKFHTFPSLFLNEDVGNSSKQSSLEMYAFVSKSLPPTAFIYLAPKTYDYIDESGVRMKGYSPLIINQGQIHYFIRQADDNAASN